MSIGIPPTTFTQPRRAGCSRYRGSGSEQLPRRPLCGLRPPAEPKSPCRARASRCGGEPYATHRSLGRAVPEQGGRARHDRRFDRHLRSVSFDAAAGKLRCEPAQVVGLLPHRFTETTHVFDPSSRTATHCRRAANRGGARMGRAGGQACPTLIRRWRASSVSRETGAQGAVPALCTRFEPAAAFPGRGRPVFDRGRRSEGTQLRRRFRRAAGLVAPASRRFLEAAMAVAIATVAAIDLPSRLGHSDI